MLATTTAPTAAPATSPNSVAATDVTCPQVPGMPADGAPVVLHTEIHKPTGGTLTYTWHNLSNRHSLRLKCGYIISELTLTYTVPATAPIGAGDTFQVGRLSIIHTTKEVLADVFPTVFHWADRNTSANFGAAFRKAPGSVTDADLWAGAYNHLSRVLGRPSSAINNHHWTFSAADAPTDSTVLAAELKTVENHYRTMMRDFLRYVSVPMINYAHLDDGLHNDRFSVDHPAHPGNMRGQGYGRTMYILAARHLGTMGRVLRASDIQTEAAQALWTRLAADPALPVRKTRTTYWQPVEDRTKTHWCLDYTRA